MDVWPAAKPYHLQGRELIEEDDPDDNWLDDSCIDDDTDANLLDDCRKDDDTNDDKTDADKERNMNRIKSWF